MPVLIRAQVDRASGAVYLRFPFDRETVATVKSVPGSRWDPETKRWRTSVHGLAVLNSLGLKIETVMTDEPRMPIPHWIAPRLRPYQVEAAEFLIRNPGALLTFDMRVGKTPTSLAAASAYLAAGAIKRLVIVYPAQVRLNWDAEMERWMGLRLLHLEGVSLLDQTEIEHWRAQEYLAIGVNAETLDKRERDLHRLLAGKHYAMIMDEIHLFKNRKAGRTKALRRLRAAQGTITTIGEGEAAETIADGICVAGWGLTGTPMRNRNRDMYCMFDLALPDSMGGYWTYAKRYCGAFLNDNGHWEDKGNTNNEELAFRLAAISYRKTRAEVAAYLPKSERRVIACAIAPGEMKKYRAMEAAVATQARGALADADPTATDRDALRNLAMATAKGKIPTAVDRAYEHTERGVKVLVAALFHETLQGLDDAFDAKAGAEKRDDTTVPPHFCAGGWMTPAKRKQIIDQWKACPGPAILLVNTLSSGVGIDLSDAEVCMAVELCWVPADQGQFEARIQDVHLGKATTPRVYEYLIVKDTVDEAMAAALLEKVRNIDQVVGRDAESSGMATALREANVVGSARLGLPATDKETVQAAILSIRDRLMGRMSDPDGTKADTAESLAADAAETDWDEEEDNDDAE